MSSLPHHSEAPQPSKLWSLIAAGPYLIPIIDLRLDTPSDMSYRPWTSPDLLFSFPWVVPSPPPQPTTPE
ncbi:hypothetical protein CesoFtcFv8_011800 [Champsocephalus esox]|uniref:Uncharacterized protein n=1 Tax=Champsocephalus esox TaxID=159716 RepID=A0AAN8C1A0_9TELE|nr:hypothetical protein CesoFtcFv8_011800 [Champsocephalus esox]